MFSPGTNQPSTSKSVPNADGDLSALINEIEDVDDEWLKFVGRI